MLDTPHAAVWHLAGHIKQRAGALGDKQRAASHSLLSGMDGKCQDWQKASGLSDVFHVECAVLPDRMWAAAGLQKITSVVIEHRARSPAHDDHCE